MTKLLFLDIETAPSVGYVWGKWEQNVIDFKSDWYILSYAYRWVGGKRVTAVGLDDFPIFKRDKENDSQLLASLWKLLDEADIIIAHNGDGFDMPKINTRFISHKMKPPSPYKTVDTLKIARRAFKFDSNKLDDLGRYLGVGRKLPHTGFHLWKGCMSGEPKSWALMKRYNAHDVELLEKVYIQMRSWAPTHPTVLQGVKSTANCPKCGSNKLQKRGFSYTAVSQKQRFQCQKCNGWHDGPAIRIRENNG